MNGCPENLLSTPEGRVLPTGGELRRSKRLLELTSDLMVFKIRPVCVGNVFGARIAAVFPRSGSFGQGRGKGGSMGTGVAPVPP